jgi:hypothetical protein
VTQALSLAKHVPSLGHSLSVVTALERYTVTCRARVRLFGDLKHTLSTTNVCSIEEVDRFGGYMRGPWRVLDRAATSIGGVSYVDHAELIALTLFSQLILVC